MLDTLQILSLTIPSLETGSKPSAGDCTGSIATRWRLLELMGLMGIRETETRVEKKRERATNCGWITACSHDCIRTCQG